MRVWSSATDAPSQTATSGNLAAELFTQVGSPGSSLDAHVTLIADDGAYDAALRVDRVDGKPFRLSSWLFLIDFPQARKVLYAYVNSYRLDGGTEVSCPSEPSAVEVSTPSGPQPLLEMVILPHVTATFLQALPDLPCGKAYVPAEVVRAIDPVVSGQIPRPYTAQVEIALDSTGRLVKAWIYKSTGVPYFDSLALAAAQSAQYSPAQFLCVPIVSKYLFRADFQP